MKPRLIHFVTFGPAVIGLALAAPPAFVSWLLWQCAIDADLQDVVAALGGLAVFGGVTL